MKALALVRAMNTHFVEPLVVLSLGGKGGAERKAAGAREILGCARGQRGRDRAGLGAPGAAQGIGQPYTPATD
jgi:molybdenum-dependent DNA-binding transcriptional regulator ModE